MNQIYLHIQHQTVYNNYNNYIYKYKNSKEIHVYYVVHRGRKLSVLLLKKFAITLERISRFQTALTHILLCIVFYQTCFSRLSTL